MPRLRLLAVLLLLFASAIALAQTVTSTLVDPNTLQPEDLPGIIALMVKTFRSGGYALASGLLLTIVVALARLTKMLNFIPAEYDKWVAMTFAMLTSVAVGLVSGQSIGTMAITAANVGAIAIGGWETVIKYIRDAIMKKSAA